MTGRQYLLQGTVLREGTRQGVADLRVEIWVKMPAQDERLGETTSDRHGQFAYDFQQCCLKDLFLGHPPDLFFKIFRDGEAIALASASKLVWKTVPGDGKTATVELQVKLPAPEPAYTVRGTVRNDNGLPLEGVLVKAFAIISPFQEKLLGEKTTDKEGNYEILYKPSQFRETGQQNADLLVRVYAKADSTLLLTSPTYFQAPSPLTINLGGEPPQPSEYETLLTEITPLLHQTPLAELTPEAIAFLAAKTELDPQAIAFLALSARLAQETKLPQAAFYGFFRQQLPTSLLPLLAYGRAEWQEALDTALAENLIPASLRNSRDSILERLQQMAEEADAEEPDPSRPNIRLNYRLLGHSVLDNLQSNDPSRDFINATLNATLKRVLSDAFSREGYAVLAAFCETLPETNLAAQAGVSVRSFMAIQIEAVLQGGDRLGIASTLKAALPDLSATTTIGQLLGLESPLQDHPLFDDEAKQLNLRTLLNTSFTLANRQLQDTFIRQYRAHRGAIEQFWQEKLPQAQGFQDSAVVRETQLTLQLGRLTQNNMPLLRTLQEMRRERSNEFQTTRYLTRLSLTEWKQLIHSSVPAGTEPEIPATIPGKTVEEKVANYATSLVTQLERAYPTDFVFQVQGLRDIPGIDPPTLRYLLLFFAQSPDFDFRQVRVDSYLKEQGETALRNIPDPDRAKVKLQLKRLERVFQVAPRPAQMQVLLKEGLDSAYSIASVPFKAFMGRFADKLGGDEAAEAIYNNAQNITATTMQAFISRYQTQFDVTPFVLRESESSASRQARPLSQHVLRGAGVSTSIKVNPTWEAFFGSLDLCDCQHCQSLYSPSAYFVDLLQFIKQSGDKPFEVLKVRRPDLLHIKLTCENATTPLPYIDLINEILEYYVGYGGVLAADAAQDTGNLTPDELIANPQYTVERAYQSLSEAKYAPNLPFNRNVEVARTYLEHLGSSRYEVMNLFRRDKNLAAFMAGQRAVDAEFIKMTEEEYRLLTGKNFDGKNVSSPTLLSELYGYLLETLPSAKPLPELKKSDSGSFVIVLQRLLNITGADPLLVVDGQFGDKTEEAVKTFQESHGLIKTGIVNAQTWKQLKSVQPALWKLFVTQVPEFLNQMAIGYEELLELLKTRFINPARNLSAFMQQNHLDWRKLQKIIKYVEVNPECPELLRKIAQWGLANREKIRQFIVLNTPSSSQCDLSVTLIQHPDGSDINDFELAKLVLFIRLWRKLGWSIAEVDQSFTALSATNIPNLLQKLSWVQQLNCNLNLPLMQLFSLWADIETTGDPSLYSQLFLNKAAQEIDPAFQPNNSDGSILTDDSQTIAAHVSTLLSAFRISETDLELIRIDAKLTAPETLLTLANVSKLYRYVVLAKALKLPIKDLIDFKTLSGINPFASPARTLKFVAIVRKVRDSEFSLAQLNYLYRHIAVVPGSFGPQQLTLLLLAKKLRDGLTQIITENQLVDDPNGEITRSKIALIFEPEVADRLVQFVKDATVSHKASLDVLTALKFPEEIGRQFTSLSVEEINQKIEIVKPRIIQVVIEKIIEIISNTDVSNKISYNPTDKCFTFTGYLTEQAKLSLLNGANAMYLLEGSLRNLLARTPLISELSRPEQTLLIDSYQAGIIKEYQRAINTLFDSSKDDILPVISDAYIFIERNLAVVLHPHETIDCLIEYSSVAEIFTYILEQFLPYLRDLLSRRFVKQTVSDALKLDSKVTELLLERILKSPLEPEKTAIHAALTLKTQGLGATYFSTPDLTGQPLAFETDLAIAFDGKKTFLVEGTHSVRWRGWLQVPDNGDYTFSIRTNGKVKLWLGETPDLIIDNTDSPSNSLAEISSTAIPLKVGQLYELRLELSQLPDPAPNADPAIAPIAEFSWSKGTAEKSIISSENFYPGWCLDRFIATYTLLDKVALLIGGLKLTAKEVNYLTSHAADFNNLTLQAFPLHRLTPKIVDGWAKTLFKQWQRLHDFVTLRNSLPQGEVSLIDVFVQASATNVDLNHLIEKLTQASGWDAPSLQYLVGAFGFDLKPTNFRHEIWISYLKSCLALSKRLGVSVEKLFEWFQGHPGFAQNIKDTVKAKYDDQTWLTIAKPLNDILRERQKAALIAYILTMPSICNQGITNSNQLFEYFLIDVEMTACMKTSRLKQAIASVQLFIQRCLMNLEPGVSPESIDDEQWEWRKRYRVWEANRKIFLYPENWIYPELRDDKSPFFKELESELLQNDLNELNVEKALLHYLEKLDKVSRLEICSMYWEGEDDNRKPGDEILHVFGRVQDSPEIYYRKLINRLNIWTAWEAVNVSIDVQPDGVHLIPVVFNRRLYLFWPIFTEKPSTEPPAEGEQPKTHWEIQLAWSEYRQNKWSPKLVSSTLVVSNPLIIAGEEIELGVSSTFIPPEFDFETGQFLTAPSFTYTYTVEYISPIYYLAKPKEHYFRICRLHDELEIVVCKQNPKTLVQKHTKKDVYKEIVGNEEKVTGEEILDQWEEERYLNYYERYNFVGRFVFKGSGIGVESYNKVTETSPFISFDLVSYYSENSFFENTWGTNKYMLYDNPTVAGPDIEAAVYLYNLISDQSIYPILVNQIPTCLPCRVLIPHQRKWQNQLFLPPYIDSAFYPFFYQDKYQTYFVRPVSTLATLQIVEFARIEPDIPKIPRKKKYFELFNINNNSVALSSFKTRIFEKIKVSDIGSSRRLGKQQNVANGESSGAIVLSEEFDPFSGLNSSFANSQDVTLYSHTITGIYQSKLKFEIHYHPYVSNLIAFLNRDGISGLLSVDAQYWLGDWGSTFPNYQPQDIVHPDFPVQKIDFEPGGAYSLYNWELFFHIPLLIATRLTQDRRFSEAQKWLHYIFNPTNISAPSSTVYYWNVLPFRTSPKKRIQDILESLSYNGKDESKIARRDELDKQVKEWAEHPFLPYLVARTRMLQVIRDVKVLQLDEAQKNKTALEKTKEVTKVRESFYAARVKEGEENKRSPQEDQYLKELAETESLEESGQSEEKTASQITTYMPDATAGYSGMGGHATVSMGRGNLIAYYQGLSSERRFEASKHSHKANLASILASWDRRAEDWLLQKQLAQKELEQIEKQILASEVRIDMATKEISNHDQQVDNAKAIEEFLQNKYTNQELYTWMTNEISAVFFQSYQMAYDLAKRAERSYRFELGLTESESNYIQFGYWDSLRKGLMAGEKLYHDLKRLEIAYLDQNKREYEISKNISLILHDPIALITLKETGQCEFELPEMLFDADYPGHYLRRIKNVSLTIPCITGPYTSVNCTLTLLKNEIRIKSIPNSDYKKQEDDNRFVTNFATMQSIATSTAQNDSGLFEVNFRDERYLPFEGAGVISRWRIELPKDCNAFDFNTIADVILKLNYTAREGGELLKKAAKNAMKEAIAENTPLARLFSAKHEFPAQWHQFLTSETLDDNKKLCQTLELNLTSERFPYLFRGKKITVNKVEIFLKFKNIYDADSFREDGTPSGEFNKLQVFLTPPENLEISGSFESNLSFGGIPYASIKDLLKNGLGIWKLQVKEEDIKDIAETLQKDVTIDGEPHQRLKAEVIEDFFIVFHYSVPTSAS